jgi:transposase-like protein
MAGNNSLVAKLAELRERRRWTKDDARDVLEAQERSGESVRTFALAHGLHANRLYKWRALLAEEERGSGDVEQLSFAPVVVTGLGRVPTLVVRLGELEIDVLDPQKVEPRWLAQLITAAQGGG